MIQYLKQRIAELQKLLTEKGVIKDAVQASIEELQDTLEHWNKLQEVSSDVEQSANLYLQSKGADKVDIAEFRPRNLKEAYIEGYQAASIQQWIMPSDKVEVRIAGGKTGIMQCIEPMGEDKESHLKAGYILLKALDSDYVQWTERKYCRKVQHNVPFTEEEIDAMVDEARECLLLNCFKNPARAYKEGLIDMQNKLKLQAGWSDDEMKISFQAGMNLQDANIRGDKFGHTPGFKECLERWKRSKT